MGHERGRTAHRRDAASKVSAVPVVRLHPPAPRTPPRRPPQVREGKWALRKPTHLHVCPQLLVPRGTVRFQQLVRLRQGVGKHDGDAPKDGVQLLQQRARGEAGKSGRLLNFLQRCGRHMKAGRHDGSNPCHITTCCQPSPAQAGNPTSCSSSGPSAPVSMCSCLAAVAAKPEGGGSSSSSPPAQGGPEARIHTCL